MRNAAHTCSLSVASAPAAAAGQSGRAPSSRGSSTCSNDCCADCCGAQLAAQGPEGPSFGLVHAQRCPEQRPAHALLGEGQLLQASDLGLSLCKLLPEPLLERGTRCGRCRGRCGALPHPQLGLNAAAGSKRPLRGHREGHKPRHCRGSLSGGAAAEARAAAPSRILPNGWNFQMPSHELGRRGSCVLCIGMAPVHELLGHRRRRGPLPPAGQC